MDYEQLIEKIKECGTTEDDVTRRSILSEIEAEVNTLHNSNQTLTEQNTNLASDNQRIREENMRLFLKVGEEREPQTDTSDKPKEKRKFENLFK